MSEADHKRPRRRAAGWLLAGILLLALCGAMAAFQASTAGSAASVVPNPRGQPFGSLSAAAVSAMASNESPTAADAEGVDWDYWRVVNPAIVAWVSVDGTAIDYAVVQAPGGDPDYYLSHDIYRSWNPYGCPYVDAACDGVGGMSAVVYLGVFSTCLCYFLQTTAQKHVNSTKAAIILSTESLFGSIFSVLLGYDPLSAQMVVGGVIILASIILPEFSFGKKEEPAVVEKKEEV